MTNHDGNWGILQSQQDEDQARAKAASDPASYHANIAAGELHWFDPNGAAWLGRSQGDWHGWHARTGASAEADADWAPWTTPLDDSAAPFY